MGGMDFCRSDGDVTPAKAGVTIRLCSRAKAKERAGGAIPRPFFTVCSPPITVCPELVEGLFFP
jgi:hypothetical protein